MATSGSLPQVLGAHRRSDVSTQCMSIHCRLERERGRGEREREGGEREREREGGGRERGRGEREREGGEREGVSE